MSDKLKIGKIAETTGVDPTDVYRVIRYLVDSGWFRWSYVTADADFKAAQDDFVSTPSDGGDE